MGRSEGDFLLARIPAKIGDKTVQIQAALSFNPAYGTLAGFDFLFWFL